jgi:hypothetical protein
VRATAGLSSDDLPRRDVEIRGRTGPTTICLVEHAGSLSALIGDEAPVAA